MIDRWSLRSYLELAALPAGGFGDRHQCPDGHQSGCGCHRIGRTSWSQVWDSNDWMQQRQDSELHAEHGRGLLIVEAFCADRGVYRPEKQVERWCGF